MATKARGSALDGRTTRHVTYRVLLRARKRAEEIFGRVKTAGRLRKIRHIGLATFTGQSVRARLRRVHPGVPGVPQ